MTPDQLTRASELSQEIKRLSAEIDYLEGTDSIRLFEFGSAASPIYLTPDEDTPKWRSDLREAVHAVVLGEFKLQLFELEKEFAAL